MSNNQVGRQPKQDKSTYTEYRVAQALAKLSNQINQYGVALATISARLEVLEGAEARIIKKIDESHLVSASKR